MFELEFLNSNGGPSPKAKYSLTTDSELVPRGKGEIELLNTEWNRSEIKCLQSARGII